MSFSLRKYYSYMRTSVLAALMLLVTSSFAQKQNIIKANLVSPILKSGSFFYERILDTDKSLQLGIGFTSYSPVETKLSGIFITPEFRYYLTEGKEAPRGFYLAPYLRYQSLNIEDKASGSKAELSTIGGGVVVGHQWLFKNTIALDIFLGPSYNKGNAKSTDSQNQTTYTIPGAISGFGLRSGITLGVAF